MYFNSKTFLVLFFSLLTHISIAEEVRDYYAEPGLNPFKETLQDLNESIDPFSGTLQQKYTDIVIPGNGGLDIRINRTYTSPQDINAPGTASAYGVGWTIHFGRIVTSQSNANKLCIQGAWSTSTRDNPSLELPDGGRELLVLPDPILFPELEVNELITRSNWKAKCFGTDTGTDISSGLIVTSPSGTKYTMNEYSGVVNGDVFEPSWFTSHIEDTKGNSIDISYVTDASSMGYKMIDSITSSDGRVIKFNYIKPDGDLPHLDTITAHYQTSDEQTWQYNYASVNGVGAYQLIEVVRPDGNNWQYDYKLSTALIGKYAMSKVTYPQGGIVDYTYDHVTFNPGVTDQIVTTVISSKSTSGNSVTPGTWTYDYAPGNFAVINPTTGTTQNLDVTTVTTPTSLQKYYYFGKISKAPSWGIGMLARQETFDITGSTLLDDVVNHWGSRKISDENYWHGSVFTAVELESKTPILLDTVHWQGGFNYRTYFNDYDRFGNPQQIIETANYGADRITDYQYYTDSVNWIIADKVESETIQGIGTILREFNTDGTLKNESKYGVLTEYTYHSTGDLATLTNARGKIFGYTTKFNDYYRGIAQEEMHPVSDLKSITTNKVINLTGTVQSKTNGRGFTTNFTYDKLNRLQTIIYPKIDSSSVNINYTATSKILTRGSLQQSITVNGFGQAINTTIKDTSNSITISTTQDYDAIGQLIFKSHPSDTIGTSFQYDALGRQTRIDHPDSTFRIIEHLDHNDLRVTDERNIQTTYWYRAFGDPSNKSLIKTISPENITTSIVRNHLDQIKSVWQGVTTGGSGYARTYEYYSNYFLKSITNPETGKTYYVRDSIGNIKGKRVGFSSTTSYTYDFQNRNTFINHPNSTPDVTFGYDDNGNSVQVDNENSTRIFVYDKNDNLTTEAINIGQMSSILEYTYTNLDYLNTITYPSGKIINYSPDALGRPTQVSPYVTNVNYYPSGQTKQLIYANNQITDYTLNNRLWVEGITVGNGTVVGLTYAYDGLGNIESITDSINTLNDRTFGYDGVNRLTTADGQWGLGTYTYDWWGNLRTKKIDKHDFWYNYSDSKVISIHRNIDNYYLPIIYDLYGNMIESVDTDLSYNDASQLIRSTKYGSLPSGVTAITNYLYDGNGMRVNSINGITTTDYIFASNGNLMREYGARATQEKEYFYLGSQQIAMVSNEAESGDTTSPILIAPSDMTVEATEQLTAVSLGTPIVNDNLDSALIAIADDTGPFAVGTHAILWSATDAAGNVGYAFQTLTITDTIAPAVSAPANITTEATHPLTRVALGSATATDIVDGTISAYNSSGNKFSVGTHSVTWTATDAVGNVGSADQIVTITDTTAPVITVPADILLESTGPLTSVDLGIATSRDLVDGVILPIANPIGPYAIGIHTITWSTTDTAGNVSSATQIVTIIDSSIIDETPPVVTAPANITAEATGLLTDVGLGEATAFDVVSGVLVSTADITGPFTVGTHIITWSATDAKGNVGFAIQTITVEDTAAPVFYYGGPRDKTIEAEGELTPFDLRTTPYMVDLVDGVIFATHDYLGGPLALGTHTITWSATDAAGNTGTQVQTILVQDSTKPVITVPDDIVRTITVPGRVTVDIGQASATDIFGITPITNDAPVDFGIGINRVNWTVADTNGNVAENFSLVTVIYAPDNSSWSSPVDLVSGGSSISEPKLVKTGNGIAMAMWDEYSGTTVSLWTARYTIVNGWEAPVMHYMGDSSTTNADIDMDSVGNAAITWVEREYRIVYPYSYTATTLKVKEYRATSGWGTQSTITPHLDQVYPGLGIGDPNISINNAGNMHLVWVQEHLDENVGVRALYGTVYKSGLGWESQIPLYSDPGEGVSGNAYDSRAPTLSKNDTGKILLSWHQDYDREKLFSRYYDESLGWSAAHHDSSLDTLYPSQYNINSYMNENNQGVVMYDEYRLGLGTIIKKFNAITNTWSPVQRAYDINKHDDVKGQRFNISASLNESGDFTWVGGNSFREFIEEQYVYTDLIWSVELNNSTGTFKNEVLYGLRGGELQDQL